MAWALVCIAGVTADKIAIILERAMEMFTGFGRIELSQLYQCWLFVRVEHSQSCSVETHFEDRLRLAYTQITPQPFHLQRDVSDALSEMGWMHEFEYVTEEGLSLDMAQPISKHGVEVNGPCHYLTDIKTGQFVENGSTRLKTRLLEGLGWTVLPVPFYEWDRLETKRERHSYLAAKLAGRCRCLGE